MILVTLGTQDKPFNRLLEEIQRLIDIGVIKDEVIVQAGCTKFKSKDMQIFDLIPMEEFDNLIKKCDILITHGGVGSIITGLKNNKLVIAVARHKEYKEHVNNHQEQILKNFESMGYIIAVYDIKRLEDALEKVKTFKPNTYESNTMNMINLVKKCIDE